MNEKNLDELKRNFQRSVFKYARQNKTQEVFDNVWKRIVCIHRDRPYHNLSLAFNDLNTARNLGMFIPDYVIVAAVLRYGSFNSFDTSNVHEAIGWSAMFLRHALSWPDEDIEMIKKLIKASSNLIAPTESSPMEEKLIHDMKMSRFAKSVPDFLQDRQNLRKEFDNINDHIFYYNEQTMLMACYHTNVMFICHPFKSLTTQVQDNLFKRLTWVSDLLRKYHTPKDKQNDN